MGFPVRYAVCETKAMVRHYFTHFLRNLSRQKLFSFINLLGLTVSIACTMLIYLYVRHELSYDRFHEHAERIYRINQTFIWGENSDAQFASTGPGVAYAINEEVPEVELITSIHTPGTFIISHAASAQEVISFEEENILAVDTNFFRMFNFPVQGGNSNTALRQANTLLMTASTARKYFGEQSAVGKMVTLSGLGGQEDHTYEVTGVVQDPPDNSYIQFDILLSMKSFPVDRLYWSWIWTQLETYVRIAEGANMDAVTARLTSIPAKHAEQTLQRVMNTTFEEYIRSGKKWDLFMQPLTGIHLPTETVFNRLNDSGNFKTVYSLAGAAIVIVLLACINFMNLSTAQFTRRIREASLRKILGQGKTDISVSYFIEALIFCLAGLLLALVVTQSVLPAFNLVTGKTLRLDLFADHALTTALIVLVLVMAAISSSYPAWFLSSFNPALAIKGKIKPGREGKSFRNGLVVFQFSISIFLMLSTVIVFQQLHFISEKDPGFDKENLLMLHHVESLTNGETFAEASRHVPGVLEVSHCSSLPPRIFGGDKFTADGINGNTFPLNFTSGDEHFVRTLGIDLKYGRVFSKDVPADSFRVILNETAVREIGWALDESVIGRKLRYPNYNDASFEVVGVVSDFNYWSLQTPIEPLGIFHINNKLVHAGDRRYLALRVRPQDGAAWEETIAGLNQTWKVHAGDVPFQYTFVDDVFAETFQTQQRLGQVLTVLAILAMLIAGLGLMGMMLYALEQRMKEIGIRKISGATTGHIVMLISGGYFKLIFIAFVLATPIAYWFMQEWLQDFAYRITPSPISFLLVGAGALTVGFLITGFHCYSAARMNPVDILRDE